MSASTWGWAAIGVGLLLVAPYVFDWRRSTVLLVAGLPLIVAGSTVVWWQMGAFG